MTWSIPYDLEIEAWKVKKAGEAPKKSNKESKTLLSANQLDQIIRSSDSLTNLVEGVSTKIKSAFPNTEDISASDLKLAIPFSAHHAVSNPPAIVDEAGFATARSELEILCKSNRSKKIATLHYKMVIPLAEDDYGDDGTEKKTTTGKKKKALTEAQQQQADLDDWVAKFSTALREHYKCTGGCTAGTLGACVVIGGKHFVLDAKKTSRWSNLSWKSLQALREDGTLQADEVVPFDDDRLSPNLLKLPEGDDFDRKLAKTPPVLSRGRTSAGNPVDAPSDATSQHDIAIISATAEAIARSLVGVGGASAVASGSGRGVGSTGSSPVRAGDLETLEVDEFFTWLRESKRGIVKEADLRCWTSGFEGLMADLAQVFHGISDIQWESHGVPLGSLVRLRGRVKEYSMDKKRGWVPPGEH